MYKAVIFYFSGTGNTWWVAEKIKKQLDSRNINAYTVSVEKTDAKKADWWIKSADLVFFGWPVYGSDMPETMKKFVDALLPVERGKHIHTFCTQAVFSGDGAWMYHRHFKSKGLTIDSAQHFIMPSNISSFRWIFAPPDDKTAEKIMKRCEARVERYVTGLLTGKSRIRGKYSYPLGILQRAPVRLFLDRFRSMVGVDKSRCIKCGICAQICPADNIKMNGCPEFSGRCALCFRCYALCPQSAITAGGKPYAPKKPDKKPYCIRDRRFKSSILKKP